MKVIEDKKTSKSLCNKLTRRIQKRILAQAIFGHIFADSDFITLSPNRSSGYMFDAMITRFENIGKAIFESLDGQSLQNCREASRFWSEYLEKNKIPWINMIQSVVKISNKDYPQSALKWKKLFRKTKVSDVKLFAIILQKEKSQIDFKKKSILHLAAMFKKVDFEVFKNIYDAEENKTPRDLNGDTPIHIAARYGNLDVFKWLWICPNTDGNAKNFRMNSPLHIAAESGQFNICKFMAKQMKKKPRIAQDWPLFRNFDDETPLTLAKRNYHKKIIKLFYAGEPQNDEEKWIIYLFNKIRPYKEDSWDGFLQTRSFGN